MLSAQKEPASTLQRSPIILSVDRRAGHSPLAWPVLGAIANATHDQDYFLELFQKELAPALRHKKKVA